MALIPNLVDQRAQTEPERLYAEYPISTGSYEEGYRKISYRDFANAINAMAWWLYNTLGPRSDKEVLAYIGPNDLRYPALVLGAVKAGFVMFLPSPRNSLDAQINLFDQLKCKTLLHPRPCPPPVTEIIASHNFRTEEIPSVDDLLGKHHQHFPFDKRYYEVMSEPLFAVHTSGSTGFPKHLIYTHATAARNAKMMSLNPPPGYKSVDQAYQGKRVFLTFPPFHGAYLVSLLFSAVHFGTIIISPTSGTIPSAEGMVQGIKKTPANVAFIVPSIIQELSQRPDLLEYCAQNLEAIIYCGGDLPVSIGDIIASKIRLLNQFGATELGLTANIFSLKNRGKEDWKYVQFHPDLGIDLRHVRDNMHELYVVHDPLKEEQQPTFTLFPYLQEYSSRDLFERHPSECKSNLWSWRARADDIIVFLNGEKTNPVSMEQHIVSHLPKIKAALVVGAQRFQAALLIEPTDFERELTPSERGAFIEKIWPTIEDANRQAPSHARILKSHIVFTHPQKPMLRAGKGTVQRSGTLLLYKDDIDSLYADADTISTRDNEVGCITGDLNHDNVSRFIRESILSITSWKTLDDGKDFFTLGMDSLHSLMMVRRIKQGLAVPTIAPSTIYANPSVGALTNAILRLSQENDLSANAQRESRLRVCDELLKEYRSRIDQIQSSTIWYQKLERQVVILTGSTGVLGSYTLDRLVANPSIAHVFCLNRKIDSSSYQIAMNKSLSLSTPLDPARVTFITTNLSESGLGLDKKMLEKLRSSVTLVVHNAWPVDFKLSLQSFRPQFEGLVNLIDFVAAASLAPHLLFISSFSSVLSNRSNSTRIPEQVIYAQETPGPNGYAESKYVAELLLDYATQKLAVTTSFARVGQVAGAAYHKGLWRRTEWFPSLIQSSLHVGALPDTLGPTFSRIDWVPVDILAEVLVEISLSEFQGAKYEGHNAYTSEKEMASSHSRVYHPLNPHPITWEAMRAIVAEELSSFSQGPVETISLHSWLARVRQRAYPMSKSPQAWTEEEIEASLLVNPAVRLLDFFEEVLGSQDQEGNILDIEKTLEVSPRLRDLPELKVEWIQKWVREWMQSS